MGVGWPQTGQGEGELAPGVLPLQQICMHSAAERVPPPVVPESQKRRESDPSHASADGPFLGVEPVGHDPLRPSCVECGVCEGVVRLLEHDDIVRSALVEVPVLVGVDGIDLHADAGEVLRGLLHAHPDVLQVGVLAGFPGQD